MGDNKKPTDDGGSNRSRATLGVGFSGYDADLYGQSDGSLYSQEVFDDDDDNISGSMDVSRSATASGGGGGRNIRDSNEDHNVDIREYSERYGSGINTTKIVDKESSYMARRHNRGGFSPSRTDAFSGETPARSYKDIMLEQQLANEEAKIRKAIASGEYKPIENSTSASVGISSSSLSSSSSGAPERRRRRWDDAGGVDATPVVKAVSDWAQGGAGGASVVAIKNESSRPARTSRWDETPAPMAIGTMTGGGSSSIGGGSWDVGATPRAIIGGVDSTPMAGGEGTKKRSRWDDTPAAAVILPGMANLYGATPSMYGMTPSAVMATPSVMTQAEIVSSQRVDADIDERNRYMTDEELDAILPPTGYKILIPPASYVPIRNNLNKLLTTPTPVSQTPGFSINLQTASKDSYAIPLQGDSDLPPIKPEDMQYFSRLLEDVDEERMTLEEQRERRIMKLLLNIKNGTPPQRKVAMRQITDKAKEFGAAGLFNQILPLLASIALDEQERHLLVKVIDRVLNQLGELVRPFAHKIIVVVGPMLVETDYVTKVVGRQVMSQLAKAAGLACMIQAMRPDIDHKEEFVRNTTSRCFASVASALGIPQILPFLQACCQSKKSWEGRHTGIKIVQQIAILMGSAILPHLKMLVNITEHGLVDDNQKVRTITGLAMSALAESAYPYGIEAFDSVISPLWKGIKFHRSQNMSAFLKAVGHIIPLMEPEHAEYYTKEAMIVCIREFANTDEAVKKIVLTVVEKCVSTDGVKAGYIKETIMPEFFKHFWIRRMALDRRNYGQVVKTTVEIAKKVGCSEVVSRLVADLKDDAEPYRKMVFSTIEEIIKYSGCADIEPRLEELLFDGIIYAYQEQNMDDSDTILRGFGVIVNSLGERMKPYIPQICGIIKFRLNNKNAKIRMQSADLVAKIANVMSVCKEDKYMGHLGVILFEYLGEEYPEVLGSILGALKAIVNVIGMTRMTPPIKDLLPRLTPILKNRHEKVQENCIDLVGRIADRGAEFVATKEWTRICFELLEMLKAHKKSIRRAAVNTFGYIAKAIGPHEVLHPLLNNLKVQDRQMRVCTTVAIAIVSETCSPFTVLPALMNEYRIPDLNVQNGVLKALSFMFEYIGEMAKDYVYAVTPLLEDALMDRDLVHRQTAATTVKHIALGVVGLGCEDALVHLLNYLWPNILEPSNAVHVINAVMEGLEGCIVALGPGRMMGYLLQGLYHPARRVRDVYWKVFNSLYIFAQDGIVPYYPRLEDDAENSYTRHHLELMI